MKRHKNRNARHNQAAEDAEDAEELEPFDQVDVRRLIPGQLPTVTCCICGVSLGRPYTPQEEAHDGLPLGLPLCQSCSDGIDAAGDGPPPQRTQAEERALEETLRLWQVQNEIQQEMEADPIVQVRKKTQDGGTWRARQQ